MLNCLFAYLLFSVQRCFSFEFCFVEEKIQNLNHDVSPAVASEMKRSTHTQDEEK